MTDDEWKQIQEIGLPPGFTWKKDDNAFGIHTESPLWWHWFRYELTDSQSYTQNSIWYHEPRKESQHQVVVVIDDPIHAAQFMAAKILLGIYG